MHALSTANTHVSITGGLLLSGPSLERQLGECIFIYSGSARLTSFEINFISKETSQSEPEYMNIHPPISVLATALIIIALWCSPGPV